MKTLVITFVIFVGVHQFGFQPFAQAPPSVPAAPKQQATTTSRTTSSDKSEELELQRKLAIFTGALVVVGALQFVALIGQGIVFYYTLRKISGVPESVVMSMGGWKTPRCSAAMR